MSVKQYGGRLNCGISDDAPSILLLGHGCEDTNKIIELIQNYCKFETYKLFVSKMMSPHLL